MTGRWQNRLRYNIRVINLSLGGAVTQGWRDDPICQAVERAYRAGIVVVASAGNFGKTADGRPIYGGITTPGISPFAITVGALNTKGTPWRSDDEVASYSSKGPTLFDRLIKPDIVAPGNRILSLAAPGSTIVREHPELVIGSGRDARATTVRNQHGGCGCSGAVSLLLDRQSRLRTVADPHPASVLSRVFRCRGSCRWDGEPECLSSAFDAEPGAALRRSPARRKGQRNSSSVRNQFPAQTPATAQRQRRSCGATQTTSSGVTQRTSSGATQTTSSGATPTHILWGNAETSSGVTQTTSSGATRTTSSGATRTTSSGVTPTTSSGATRTNILWGNANAILWGNANAILWGNSNAILWGNAENILWGNADAILWGNAPNILG